MRNLREDFFGKLKEWGHLGDLGRCLEDIIKKGVNVERIESGCGPVAAL
jgi:hypothetical protein